MAVLGDLLAGVGIRQKVSLLVAHRGASFGERSNDSEIRVGVGTVRRVCPDLCPLANPTTCDGVRCERR